MPDLAAGPGITLAKEAATDVLRITNTVVSGRLIFATWADLDAFAATIDGTPAEVPLDDAGTHTDPVVGGTVDNSGVFRWSEADAGWERIADVDAVSASGFADAAAASADDAATQAAVAAEYFDDLSTTRTFGRASAPITGSGAGVNNWVYATTFPVSATIHQVRVFGGSAGGTLNISRYSKSGSTFTPIGSPVAVTVTAGVLNTKTMSLAVGAGEYLGFAAAANVFTFVSATGDNGGHYNGGAGTVAAFTDADGLPSTGNQLQIAFDYKVLGMTVTEFDAVQASVAELDGVADVLTETTLQNTGRTSTPATGTNGSGGAFVLDQVATLSGTVTEMRVRSGASATLEVAAYNKSGSSFTRSGSAQSVAVVSGINTIALSIPIAAGQRVGFYNPTTGGFVFNSTTTDQTPYYNGATRDFTDATTTTSTRLEVSFTITHTEITDVSARLDALEGGVGARSGAVLSHALNFINNTGESLAEGSPDGLSITTAKEYDNVGFSAHASSPTTLVDLTYANTKSGTTGESPMYGAAGHLKELIAEENGLAYTDVEYQLACVNNGYSGDTLSQIVKGTAPYTAFLTQLTAIKTIADARGDSVSFQGSILTIGQNDSAAATAKATFKAALLQYAADMKADAKAATSQYNDPVLVCSQVATTNNRAISEAQLEAANENALIYVACPMYQFAYYSASPIHITSPETKVLGGYYGLALKRILVDKKGWEPLQPVRHAINGNTVDLFFNKDGLVFDTTSLPAQTNQGFTISDGSNSISSVAIISPNRVRLTLASAPSTSAKIRYGYNAPMSGRTDGFTGGGGNLRDSQGDTIIYSGSGITARAMHNWSVLFEYPL